MPRKPPKPVLPLHDQRMLDLIDYVVKEKINEIKSRSMALAAIGFNQGNLSQVLSAKQSFRVEHIAKAVELFGIDANYFFAKSHTKMMVARKEKSAIAELRQAVARVERELENNMN